MKIKCPNPLHLERTDSCHVYDDHVHCYGCGYRAPIPGGLLHVGVSEPEPEDLGAALSRIRALPLRTVRGLEVPSDEGGFYVVWPAGDYYKYRRFGDREPKYIGAKGHVKPLFWAIRRDARLPLFLVEGELNALSISAVREDCSVASPGGVGDFGAKRLGKHYPQIQEYGTITLVVDNDTPGALAAIDALGFLRARGHLVNYLLMDPDANDILAAQGPAALKDVLEGRSRGAVEESPI